MTDTPTLETAAEAVQARKRAAGLQEGVVGRTDEYLGVLAGTDLDHDDLEGWAAGNGQRAVPLMLAYGPVVAGASMWRDGLLIGVEYQRQRDAELRRRNGTLVGALERVRRLGLDGAATRGGEAEVLRTITRIVDTVLEARG